MKKGKKYARALIIALLLEMFVLAGCHEDAEQLQKTVPEKTEGSVFCGVKDCDLTVSDIVWEDYPGWQTVSFQVAGNITLQVPEGADIVIDGLPKDALQEKSREAVEGADEQLEVVSMEISQSQAEGKVIEVQEQDAILKAANGYCWKVLWSEGEVVKEEKGTDLTEGEYIVGCIMPGAHKMQFWSPEENQYAERNLQPYFDVFRLSKTYTDETTLNTYSLAEGIELKKQDGDMFCFELSNQNKEDWLYHPVLPAVELWYDGIWIEVESPYAETAMDSCLRAGETITVNKSDKEVDYPYFFPGLYRLVYYGKDGDCVISEVFEVK